MNKPTGYTILFRMMNPYSTTSIWKDNTCQQFIEIIIKIIIITVICTILNVSGIIWFKFRYPTYNYTTGCLEEQTYSIEIGDLDCYSNGKRIPRTICGNPIYIIDFMFCMGVGLVPIGIISIAVSICILYYRIYIDIRRVFRESYIKSVQL